MAGSQPGTGSKRASTVPEGSLMRNHSHQTNHTDPAAPAVEGPATTEQHHHASQDGPHAQHAAHQAAEQVGAAATHGHEAMAHAERQLHGGHAGHGAHGGHAGHGEEMFKRPFWVSLLLTI